MANKERGYGMTAEISDRLDAKYSKSDEKELNNWFQSLGLGCSEGPGREAFQAFLADGQVLCALANLLQPGGVRKVHDIAKIRIAAMKSMKCQENISFFLGWCKRYGMKETDLFTSVNLFEGSNMSAVQVTLFKVGSIAKTKNFNGPTIGVKVATENKRNFSADKMRAGQFIPAQTSGYNKGATQAGSTAYGTGRQLMDPNLKACDQSTIGLQSGSNQAQQMISNAHASTGRHITDPTSEKYAADYSSPGLQMGSNQGAKGGTSSAGTHRQIN